MRGQVETPPFEGTRPRGADDGDQQPAEDDKVTRWRAAKKRLEGLEKVVYGAREACESPHVTGSWVVWGLVTFQNIQEL
jgi:hypothetical protein